MICYFNNSFLPLEEIHISPFDRGFQFGDGVYEAMRTYNGKIFLLEEHLERLEKSLDGLEIPFSRYSEIEQILYELIKRNSLEKKESVFYLQVTRGSYYPRKHTFPRDNVNPTLFITVNELHQPENKPVKLILEKDIRWSRCNLKTIMLVPASMAKQKAVENGAYDALWVRNNFVLEGTHTNFFAVRNDSIFTPPASEFILSGITRNFVIELCKENNLLIKEEKILVDDLKSYNEFFITGTTTEIKPVNQIGNIFVSNGKSGKITEMIKNLFYKKIGVRQ